MSHHDDFGQVHYSKEKSNNESSTGNSKHRSLTCNYCHKKGHIRADCKKQPDANVIELIGEDEEQCDVLSVTDRSVSNKDRSIITLDVHNTSVLIGRYSLHTLRFKRRNLYGEFCYK